MQYPPCPLRWQGRGYPIRVASVFIPAPIKVNCMLTNVYIDGFNLYYRALRREPQFKWLDLAKLCQTLLPAHEINRIRYFTALVHHRPEDPLQPRRQQIYLRALRTIPNLEIHYGLFKNRVIRRPLANPVPGLDEYVHVRTTEEKGTDVNIATYLLIDGYDGDYEQAVVISNDSDLALPISIVRAKQNRPVGIINPSADSRRYPTPIELKEAATFLRHIRRSALRNSQFPNTLTDAAGAFTKPPVWT